MPRFDYKAAKAKGYTDEQIREYLTAKRSAGVDVWIDKADVQPAAAAPGPPKVAGGYFEGPSKYQENFGGDSLNYMPATAGMPYNIPLGKAIDAFPAMGGAVFGVPTGGLGATAGGASMETLRRSLRGMPLDIAPIAWEGIKQGGLRVAGGALAGGTALVQPAARLAERMAANPVAKGVAKLLPFGGYAGRGLEGAAVGAALPIAGKYALKAALSPKTAAFLGSMAFRTFARHSPQAAAAIVQQLTISAEADATQTVGSPPTRRKR